MRNLLTRVPKSAQSRRGAGAADLRPARRRQVREQHRRIVDQLATRFPEAAALLEEAETDLLAFTAFPKEHWRQLRSTDENVKGAAGCR